MPIQQLVKYSEKVPGWIVVGKTPWEIVRLVLQSLIDDTLAAMKARYVLTVRGRDYPKNPKWRLDL